MADSGAEKCGFAGQKSTFAGEFPAPKPLPNSSATDAGRERPWKTLDAAEHASEFLSRHNPFKGSAMWVASCLIQFKAGNFTRCFRRAWTTRTKAWMFLSLVEIIDLQSAEAMESKCSIYNGVLNSVFASFLDASSHLYKRVCPSVRPAVRPTVRP